MKKYTWIIIVVILIAALLFAVFYNDFKHFWLPNGNPAARPM
jgi:acyl-homoserine lactone acylase PvdQ